MKSHSNKLALVALSTALEGKDKANGQVILTESRVGGFRLRMYWEADYYWQGSNRERFWCMECDGDCEEGDNIRKPHAVQFIFCFY